MRKLAPASLLFLGLLALVLFSRRSAQPPVTIAPRPTTSPPTRMSAPQRGALAAATRAQPVPPCPPVALSAEEKAQRVERITRDYDAIRQAALRAYGEAGEAFPGGSHTLQRQLALLEREKRADLAALLEPREHEELELRETRAGHLVTRRLGPTAATEEQRRAVFRLQREFDLRFNGATAATPEAFSERDRAQRALRQRIRDVLGEALFSAWQPRVAGD